MSSTMGLLMLGAFQGDKATRAVNAGAFLLALAGIAISLLWIDAPRWLTALLYVALGWVSIVMMPQLWDRAGILAEALALDDAAGEAFDKVARFLDLGELLQHVLANRVEHVAGRDEQHAALHERRHRHEPQSARPLAADR